MTAADRGPNLVDLVEGDHFVGFYLARDARLEEFRDPSRGSYLRLILADGTAQREARVWEGADQAAEAVGVTGVVKVEGEIESYRDELQVKVLRLRAAQDEEVDLEDLLPSTERDIGEMWAELRRRIEGLQNPHLVRLVDYFFQDPDILSAFEARPAAQRIHHAYRGGLLEHVYEVLLLSDPLLALYPEIDRDLLTVGILLHDIGKIHELEGELDPSYTDQGQLIGHLALGAAMVVSAMESIEAFPEELAWQVHHLILSHHGTREWGSPRVPKTLEAIALHHLEHLDGEVNRFRNLIAEARHREERWTGYDRTLRRSLYAASSESDGPSSP